MIMLILLLAIVAVVMAIAMRAKKEGDETKQGKNSGPVEYKARDLLPNLTAKAMFVRLTEALPSHHVHAEVGLMAFIQPTGKNHYKAKGFIAQSRVDYLITTNTGAVICGIELDGSSHDNEKAAAKDVTKNEAFKLAGIRLVRVRAENPPKGDALRALVLG